MLSSFGPNLVWSCRQRAPSCATLGGFNLGSIWIALGKTRLTAHLCNVALRTHVLWISSACLLWLHSKKMNGHQRDTLKIRGLERNWQDMKATYADSSAISVAPNTFTRKRSTQNPCKKQVWIPHNALVLPRLLVQWPSQLRKSSSGCTCTDAILYPLCVQRWTEAFSTSTHLGPILCISSNSLLAALPRSTSGLWPRSTSTLPGRWKNGPGWAGGPSATRPRRCPSPEVEPCEDRLDVGQDGCRRSCPHLGAVGGRVDDEDHLRQRKGHLHLELHVVVIERFPSQFWYFLPSTSDAALRLLLWTAWRSGVVIASHCLCLSDGLLFMVFQVPDVNARFKSLRRCLSWTCCLMVKTWCNFRLQDVPPRY